MVQVEDWDLYKLPEEQRNILIALLEDLPPYCCLVFVYDQVDYKPNKTYKKLYAALEKNVQEVKFEEQSQGERVLEESTVILSTDSGEEAVLVTQRYPTFQGALVICPGGEDPAVRLALTQAVAALTGLGSDRITVCKGS